MTATALGQDKSRFSKVLSWALWDWGTQPYYTVITTFVFSVYIVSRPFAGGGDPNGPSVALSVSTFLGGIAIALLAPVIGQSDDRSGHTVRNLRWMTWAIALISASLYFVAPEPAFLWLGLGLLVLGTVLGEIASVSYNSLLDRIANQKNIGKVSGFGWGMGYLGGIIVLLIILFGFVQPPDGLFGTAAAGETPPGMFGVTSTDMRIRVAMILCGVWTLLFTIPIFLAIRDAKASVEKPERLGVLGSYKLLIRNIAHIWRTDRHTAYFLLASALFRDGLAGVFTFGAVIGSTSFGFSTTEIIIFGAAANLIAGVVTILFGLVDDWLGPKRVILICLAVIALGSIAAFALHQPGYALLPEDAGYDAAVAAQGHQLFWILGLTLSSFCGPAQAASRSFLARVIPKGHSGEIFGLYTTTGRVISFVTPLLFTVLVMAGAAQTGNEAAAQHWGLLAIAAVLIAGFAVMLPVKERSDFGVGNPEG
ncbi:MAG: MFS transporter [Propionibacteriaceae bacterium]|jgi:UMF1 family MFS transporter|nr:MFS transporter [Propionibacteriaceae bacterium]